MDYMLKVYNKFVKIKNNPDKSGLFLLDPKTVRRLIF